MIGFAYFFHNTNSTTNHLFFSDLIHTKDVDVQDYNPLTELDLVAKIVQFLIAND
jgi:hypothetical protein